MAQFRQRRLFEILPPLLETRREEKKDPNVLEKGDEKKETLIRFVYST